MKKIIITIIGALVFSLATLLIYQIVKKHHQNTNMAEQKKSLPDFQLYKQNLQPFFAKQLDENRTVCIFYYNAECEHCQYEATQINKNISIFKNTQVIMVSTNTPKETTIFAKTYKLDETNFIWLYDKDHSFSKWFGTAVPPSVYIYNQAHKLVKEHTGEIKIEAILKYLDNGKEG